MVLYRSNCLSLSVLWRNKYPSFGEDDEDHLSIIITRWITIQYSWISIKLDFSDSQAFNFVFLSMLTLVFIARNVPFQLISHFLHKYCDETAEEKMSQKCKSLAGKYRENSGSMVIEGRFKVNQGALNLSHNLISF